MPNPMTHDEKLREILLRASTSQCDLIHGNLEDVYTITQAIADINALWGEPVGYAPAFTDDEFEKPSDGLLICNDRVDVRFSKKGAENDDPRYIIVPLYARSEDDE